MGVSPRPPATEAYIRHVLDPPGVAPECAVATEVPAEEGERRADFLARWGEGYGPERPGFFVYRRHRSILYLQVFFFFSKLHVFGLRVCFATRELWSLSHILFFYFFILFDYLKRHLRHLISDPKAMS